MKTDPHVYFSGIGHMTAPDDPIFPCCDKRPGDPIHIAPTPPRTCECDRLSFKHLWGKGCPA